ncbi:MAG: 3-phosphoshikimate 1-carboxyvinyltransferase, partial [Eubacteriales bacterium]|nr:3-phosphoshikimate 1-carboxyvinyltransferase [Eubacteriales bacterium]
MIVKIIPSPLTGKINAISSKSQAHRAFICAALSQKPSFIECSEVSSDIESTIGCLTALGAKINKKNGFYKVFPIEPSEKKAYLDSGESGSTLRFILPVVSALGRTAVFSGHGRLPNRPITPLIEQLNAHGAQISTNFPIECGGRLRGGHFRIAGNISSQFISGLLLASPLLKEKTIIELTTPLESKPYIDMTMSVMSLYDVGVEINDNCYVLSENNGYCAPESIRIEGDWSNAAFWLACGALEGGGIKCGNLSQNSLQGDKAVTSILSRFGARVFSENNAISVFPGELKGIDIDASDIPDLVPVLSAVACGASGQTRIYNASRLRLKESDRLQAVTDALSSLGADITQTSDGLVIGGTGRLKGGRANAMGDHRIAMSIAVAAVICDAPV